MRNDLYFARLYGLAHDPQAKPKQLSRAMINTLLQVAEINPRAGSEALQLTRNTILREAIKSQFGIGSRKRRTKKEMEEARRNEKTNDSPKKNKGGRPRKEKVLKAA